MRGHARGRIEGDATGAMCDEGVTRQGRRNVAKARHMTKARRIAREMRVKRRIGQRMKKRKKKRKKTYQLTAASRLAFMSGKAQRAQIQEEGGGPSRAPRG